MFCSHCGKEIEDGSAFCSGCGKAVGGEQNDVPVQQVVVNQVKKRGVAGAPEEVKKKTEVVIMYSLGKVALLVVILFMLVTKFEIISWFIDFSGISQKTFNEYLSSIYDENERTMCLLSLLLLLANILDALILRDACIHRNFVDQEKGVIFYKVISSVPWIVIPPVLSIVTSDMNDPWLGNMSFSVFVYIFSALIVAYKIAYLILYYKAVTCELRYVFKELSE